MSKMENTQDITEESTHNKLKLKLHPSKTMINLILGVLLVIAFIVALFMGSYSINPVTTIIVLASGTLEWIGGSIAAITGIRIAFFWLIPHTWPDSIAIVIWQVRIPRAIAVVLAGSSLAVSGSVYQGVLRNPLVSESILGVSAGAGVGAALAILLGQGSLMVEVWAFAFGLLAATLSVGISRIYHSNPTLVMVLAGVIVGSMFSAIISLIKYVADPYTKLPDITYWLMGSFAHVTLDNDLIMAPIVIVFLSIIILIRWRINVLSMGNEEARSLGIDVRQLTLLLILCATMLTAASVCVGGLISWVGLIIPHIARAIVGPDHMDVIITSALIGGSFLLVVDLICRTIASIEIPISVVTSLLGAPIFLYLLYRVYQAKEAWA
jgi:iron complex transport system permease protein